MGKMYDALQKLEREKKLEAQSGQSDAEIRRTPPPDVILDDRLVTYFAPSSMVTEQFRRLRTHIIKPGATDGPKTIMIAGAMSGEGKSLIAANLAVIIAVELQSHALLIDCDLRNPSISRWFGMEESKGLSDYLVGNAEVADILVKTGLDKLSIMCGGTIQENPVELIGSAQMKQLLADLKNRYNDRYIILDSSPLLATTEPSVLNEMADAIILVVRAGETPRESIQEALRLLDRNKILGVVLNDMEFKTRALIQRHFGTNHKYYDYRYAKLHVDPTLWQKFGLVAKDMKMMLGRLIPGGKK